MFLKPITVKKAYVDLITSKITVWMWNNIFKECFDILKDKEVMNDDSIIREALMNGVIYYQDDAFYAKTKFPNKVASELERIGARYVKSRKAYVIAKTKLPTEIVWAVDTVKARAFAKAMAINQFLLSQLSNMDDLLKKMVFDDAVNAIMKNLQDRVYANAKAHRIELITPKLDDFMQDEIAKRYTENLDFWIKNWTEDEIVKMRNDVSQMANVGKSVKSIAEYIQKEFGISQRHAKFLARNESAMATTSYLAAKYTHEGFVYFKWHAIIDGRQRDLHGDKGATGVGGFHEGLNGRIFRFDDPPIIDIRTGQRGLPGQTYNCRCSFSPYITKEFLENRRKMFKANNSLIDRIKQIWKKTA